ncbi:MAG: lipopolysaccharide biosynthesis protein [bacterium]
MFEFIAKLWQRKLVKDAAAIYVGRGINLAVGLISTLIYGIIFLNQQIAVVSLFDMVVSLFVSFGFSWSAFGIIRFGKEEYEQARRISHTSSIRLSVILPILIFATLLLFVFRKPLLSYIGTDDPKIFLFLILNVLLLVLHEHLTNILTTAEKHVWNALFYLAQSVGKLAILLTFYFGLFSVSAELYLKMNVLFLGALILLRSPSLEKRFLFPLTRVSKAEILRFAKFVVPQIYGFTGLYLINWVDVYFIRKFCSMDDLGAYQFLYSIFLKFSSFAFLLNSLFFPKIVAWKNSNEVRFRQYLRQVPGSVLIATLVLFGAFVAVYKPLFAVFFADKYAAAYSSFDILLWAIPFFFVTYLFVPVLNSYDRVGYIQVVNIASALSNLAIDFLLVRKFGIIAAAFGTFVAYFVKFFFMMLAVNKMFSARYKWLTVASISLTVFIAAYVLTNIL